MSSPTRKREGRRGRATRPRHPDRPCLNCGDPTPGEYCPTCGQRKVDVQVSVRAMVMDVLEDQFVLNRRLPKTLGALLFRPGFLTVEHVNGRIVRYVQPFRLYLASSIVFFLLISFLGLRMIARAEFGVGPPVGDPVEEEAALAQIDSVIADPGTPPAVRGVLLSTRGAVAARADTAGVERADTAGTRPDTAPGAASMNWLGDLEATTGIPAVDSVIAQRLDRLSRMEPREALRTSLGDFLGYVPTMMFVLLPVFALFLKLLYIGKGRFYAEHFVFLLHTHSFVYLVFTLLLLFRGWITGAITALLIGWIFAYLYLAMRRVYGQGRFMTLVKYSVLGFAYAAVLAVSIPIAFAATVLLLP